MIQLRGVEEDQVIPNFTRSVNDRQCPHVRTTMHHRAKVLWRMLFTDIYKMAKWDCGRKENHKLDDDGIVKF